MNVEEDFVPIEPNYFEKMTGKGFLVVTGHSEPYEFAWKPDSCVENQPGGLPLAHIGELLHERQGHCPDYYEVGYANKIVFSGNDNKPLGEANAKKLLDRAYHRLKLTGTKVSDKGLPILYGELFIYDPKTNHIGPKEANVELYLDSMPTQKFRYDLF